MPRSADKHLRPKGLRPEDVFPPDPASETDSPEHILPSEPKSRLKGE